MNWKKKPVAAALALARTAKRRQSSNGCKFVCIFFGGIWENMVCFIFSESRDEF